MKILIISILFSSCSFFSHSQENSKCVNQQKIMKDLLSDNSIKTFFKNKPEILASSSDCQNNKSFTYNDRKVIFGKASVERSVNFLSYTRSNDTIKVEMNLFNKNVLHKRTYLIKKSDLIFLNKSTAFLRSPREKP